MEQAVDEQPPGSPAPAGDVAAAARAVPGVAGARVVRRRSGDEVRLSTRAGHDPREVADAVRAALARGAGTSPVVPGRDGGRDEQEQRPDVVDLTDPAPAAGSDPAPATTRVVVETAPEATRLELARLRVGTEGFVAVAEVVLADGDVLHVGSAETAATADGTRRALATATAQALESAGAGVLRIEVDGVQVQAVAGRPTVVVALSVVSSRGAEHLAGCALADDDPGRAVVAAVLSAANRRIELAMAERAAQR